LHFAGGALTRHSKMLWTMGGGIVLILAALLGGIYSARVMWPEPVPDNVAASSPSPAGAVASSALPEKEAAAGRLMALRTEVMEAMEELRKMPHPAVTPQCIADMQGVLKEVENAMEYLKGHPEAGAAPARRKMVPYLDWPMGSDAITSGGSRQVAAGFERLSAARDAFLQGADGMGPVGELGGHRDRAARHLSAAMADLVAGAIHASGGKLPGDFVAVTPRGEGTPGRISGRVVDAEGARAGGVGIYFLAASPDKETVRVSPNAHYFGGIFVTLTDERGEFVMEGMPPGQYVVIAAGQPAGSSYQDVARPVTVNAGGETVMQGTLEMSGYAARPAR
jgi:hypothetical protein